MQIGDQFKFWAGKRVLITGGSGLVGTWLTKHLLKAGSRVTTLSRHQLEGTENLSNLDRQVNLQRIFADVKELSVVSDIMSLDRTEIVFHLAASNMNRGSDQNLVDIYETNIRGTYNILEASRKLISKDGCLVLTSSIEVANATVYDNNGLTPETMNQPYSISKRCGELISRSYRELYGINVSTIRLPNVYGGGDRNLARIVPSVIFDILSNCSPVINVSDDCRRRFIYVEDIVQALMLVAEVNYGCGNVAEDYEFTHTGAISTPDLVQSILEVSGRFDLRLSLNPDYRLHCSGFPAMEWTAIESLGWGPELTLKEGMLKTYSWYKENVSRLSRCTYK